MFTLRDFPSPTAPQPTGNIARDMEALRRHQEDIKQWVGDIFRQLNDPGTLTITQAAIDASTIGTTTASTGVFTLLRVGSDPSLSATYPSQVVGVTDHTTQKAALGVFDTTALATGIGGTVAFGGKYTAAGAYTTWAAIQGAKDNATDGNFQGNLGFLVRGASGVYREGMRLASDLVTRHFGIDCMALTAPNSMTIPADYGAYAPSHYEIPAAYTVEVAATAVFEIGG